MSTLEEKWEDNPDLTQKELKEYQAFRAQLEAKKDGKFLISSNAIINEETMRVSGVLLARTDWCVFCKTNLLDWDIKKKKNQTKMKMFVDGCYVQFREVGEVVACKNTREKHRAADWANAFPNPNNYLCRQRNSVPPHLRPFSLDVREPDDVDERDDPTFRLTLHYYPDHESDYESSEASSTFDTDDSDISAESGTERGDRKTTRQASSAVEFVKSPESHRNARPKKFVKKPKISVKRKFKKSPGPISSSLRKESASSVHSKEHDNIKLPKHIPSRENAFESLQYQDRRQSDELFSEPGNHQSRVSAAPYTGVMHPPHGVQKGSKPFQDNPSIVAPAIKIKQKRTATPPPPKPAKKIYTDKDYRENAIKGHHGQKVMKVQPAIKRERSPTPQPIKAAERVSARALEGSSAVNARSQKPDRKELAVRDKRPSVPTPTKPADRRPARVLEGHSASSINARPQKVDNMELAIKDKRLSMPPPTKAAEKLPARDFDGYPVNNTSAHPRKADMIESATGIKQKRHLKAPSTTPAKKEISARALDGYSAKALMAYPFEKADRVERAVKNKPASTPPATVSTRKDLSLEEYLGDTINLDAYRQKVQKVGHAFKKDCPQDTKLPTKPPAKSINSPKEHTANLAHALPPKTNKVEPANKPDNHRATTLTTMPIKRVASLKVFSTNPFSTRPGNAEEPVKSGLVKQEHEQVIVEQESFEREWITTEPRASPNPLLQILDSESAPTQSEPEAAPTMNLMDMLAQAQRNLDKMTEETVSAFSSRGIDFNNNNDFSYF